MTDKHVIIYVDSSEISGGGQESLYELVSRVDGERFKPVVFVQPDSKLTQRFYDAGISFEPLSMPPIRFGNIVVVLKQILHLRRSMKNLKASLIHSNTSRATLYALIAKIGMRVPLIWHVRIPLRDQKLDWLFKRGCDLLITVSRAVGNRFPRIDSKKMQLVYNGVDTYKFKPGKKNKILREKLNIESHHYLLGTVGRLSPEKGLEYLISALKNLSDLRKDVKLIIVGEESTAYRKQLENMIEEKGLQDKVFLLGYRSDIPDLLGAMDLFCLPSLTEGLNRSCLEAMACGLPVVATRVGGNIEMIEDEKSGLLVDAGAADALEEALLFLIDNPQAALRMGTNARRRIEEMFDIDVNTNATERIYGQLIPEKTECAPAPK